jgi:hypothetical protein
MFELNEEDAGIVYTALKSLEETFGVEEMSTEEIDIMQRIEDEFDFIYVPSDEISEEQQEELENLMLGSDDIA